MHEYTVTYRAVVTVESEEEMSTTELIEHARESLRDDGHLWSVKFDYDGRWFAL